MPFMSPSPWKSITTFAMRKYFLLLLFGFLPGLFTPPVWAQGDHAATEQYRYKTARVENGPVVDGYLSDTVWENAEVIDQLIQQEPHAGTASTEKTDVRLIYDSEALYIGVYCYDSDPSGIRRNTLRFRDDSVWSK